MRISRPMQRPHARILGIGLIAAFAAGCSSDTSRFGSDPFTSPFSSSPKSEVTNTAPAPQPQQPVAQIEFPPARHAGRRHTAAHAARRARAVAGATADAADPHRRHRR